MMYYYLLFSQHWSWYITILYHHLFVPPSNKFWLSMMNFQLSTFWYWNLIFIKCTCSIVRSIWRLIVSPSWNFFKLTQMHIWHWYNFILVKTINCQITFFQKSSILEKWFCFIWYFPLPFFLFYNLFHCSKSYL